MKFRQILIIFLLFRVIDLAIIYIASFFIPYLGFFPYKEIAQQYNLPKFITTLANFDGVHYLLIAKNGYTQYQQAFFPLYPLLIRLLSPLFSSNYLLTGLFISNFSFLLGLFYLNKYLLISKYPISNIKYLFLFLIAFPSSFFFGAVYTEGLFFLLIISTLYFLKKEQYLLTILCAFFAALTKLIGLFIFIPILFHFLNSNKSIHWKMKLTVLLSPLFGIVLYSLYLLKSTGDPLFFLNAQWAFGANRSSNIILLPQVYYRYFNIFFTARYNFQYFISLIEFIVFNFVFVILVWNLFKNCLPANKAGKLEIINFDRLGLNIFSLINLLLPTLTGTFSSIPRYALFSLAIFFYLAQIRNFSLKLTIAITFTILHLVLLGFYAQGYFVS